MNNRTLAIIFAALVGIYLLSKLFGGNRDRSFDPVIIAMDTSAIEKIIVRPANNAVEFSLEKDNGAWKLIAGGKIYSATTASVNSLLATLVEVKAERIVSKNPEKQADYGVDQVAGTELELHSSKGVEEHIVVGRFSFNQATRSGISYLKDKDSDAVYAVDGFLSMSLTQGSDNYRDKTVTQLSTTDVTKITLTEGDSEFQYLKSDAGWTMETGESADSAKMVSYLNNLRTVTGTTFAELEAQRGESLQQLEVDGNNMAGPVVIDCYESVDTSHHFVIHSSINPEADFFSDSSGIYNRIFDGFLKPRSPE